MMIDMLNRLEKTGELKQLVRAGFVSTKVYSYREIYHDYNRNRKLGMRTYDAMHETSMNMRASISKVQRVRRIMER
jgi:hypothetical protein